MRTAAVKITSLSGVTVQDCILRVHSSAAETVAIGVWLENTTATEKTDLTVQRCDLQGFYSTARRDAATHGAHVYVTSSGTGGLRRVNILNNIMHGVSTTSRDMAGIQGFGNNKNLRDVIYRGNHVWNMGTQDVVNNHASGVLANGVNGGLVEYNLAHDIGATWTKCGGPVGIWAHDSTNVTIQFNEAFYVRPTTYAVGACDWSGFGLDGAAGGVTNNVVQYNWSHDNAGSGFYHWGGSGSGNNVYRFNISARNNGNRLINFGEFSFNGLNNNTTGRVDVYNNTFYGDASGRNEYSVISFQGLNAGMPSNTSVIANNLLSMDGNGFGYAMMVNGVQNTPTPIWGHNAYHVRSGTFRVANWGGGRVGNQYNSYSSWQALTGEIGGVVGNPQFVALDSFPTIGAYSPPEPFAYALQGGSPLIGTGGDVERDFGIVPGTQDYYGISIPHGTGSGFNIGASAGSSSAPYITVSATSVNEGSPQGTDVGTLSITNSPAGNFTYSTCNSAMGRVQVNGSTLQAGSTVTTFTDMALLLVCFKATNGTVTLQRYFVITVKPGRRRP